MLTMPFTLNNDHSVSALKGTAVKRISRPYETEGMAGLKHGKCSLREGKNLIQTENQEPLLQHIRQKN